ncbi:EAL domain-containing protein [Paraburkholderia sp. Se-20369]|nr:EAL domain-containing protein [Paraburkholderia sp. Se-20369]
MTFSKEGLRFESVLYDDLRMALLRREFLVVYQPIVDIASNAVVSREALVRWQHPKKGMVMPGDFIEAAERMGFILDMTNVVLEQVCRMLNAGGESRSPVPVSVNLSPVCLAAGGVPDSIRCALERFDALPDQIILEITETAALEPARQVRAQLEALRAMGIKIVMDDFGTGYSSLLNLSRFPMSGLKVDRSFSVNIPHDARVCAIVASMIELAHKLDLSIVIEGVETRQQVDWIRQFPNVLAQGYWFGKPSGIDRARRSRFEA